MALLENKSIVITELEWKAYHDKGLIRKIKDNDRRNWRKVARECNLSLSQAYLRFSRLVLKFVAPELLSGYFNLYEYKKACFEGRADIIESDRLYLVLLMAEYHDLQSAACHSGSDPKVLEFLWKLIERNLIFYKEFVDKLGLKLSMYEYRFGIKRIENPPFTSLEELQMRLSLFEKSKAMELNLLQSLVKTASYFNK